VNHEEEIAAIKAISQQPKIIPGGPTSAGRAVKINKDESVKGIFIIKHEYDGKPVKTGRNAYDDVK